MIEKLEGKLSLTTFILLNVNLIHNILLGLFISFFFFNLWIACDISTPIMTQIIAP